jgi:hypothetical protein
MAEPLRITRSLDDVTTGYTVFEEDQILTHVQLNDLAGYLDDQDRLTRVALLGVGIVCGLRAALREGRVTVTKGAGVTTDGDLLRLPADVRFDRFKAYDRSAPAYPPFYEGQNIEKDMLPVFELVREGEDDDRAEPLDKLPEKLGDMAALLLMESYVKDDDLCSGTDCDNLGRGAVHTGKILLIGKSDLAALRENLPTLDRAARQLPEVMAERPLITSSTTSPNALNSLYRKTCDNIHQALAAALRGLYPACESLLADLFASDPAGEWLARLEAIRAGFASNGRGIQYHYDFLKNLAENYSAFRDLLFGEATLCCPDVAAFPKHLLLGPLEGDDAEMRTGFYPSPLTSRTAGQRGHARFLAGKLDAMIRTFKLPAAAGEIRITPSRGEVHSLEERAIPFYYEVDDKLPIYRAWSHALTQRGMERSNYSYSAERYSPGAVARQLGSQLGRFDFFRIEGHLGHDAGRAVGALEEEIRNRNLPIQVRAVALSAERKNVAVKPPIRYTDLHRFHYLLRQDLVSQLEDTQRFSGSFKRQVEDALDRKVVIDQSEDTDGASVRDLVNQRDSAVTSGSKAASKKLDRSYQEYARDPSWRADLSNTMAAAGELKANLGKVVKTEFTTPFDSLIGSNQMLWLGWLDDIIKNKDEKEDDKLLFANFLARHPGLEHFAGVTRGGTFVLAYDTDNIVVADFMLPYICCEPVEEEPEEPRLPKPEVKPPFVLDAGIKILPSRERFVLDKLSGFRAEIEPQWKKDVQIQRDYVDAFRDSVNMMGTVFTGDPRRVTDPRDPGLRRAADPLLDLQLRDLRIRVEKVDLLRTEALKPDLDPERQKALETQLRDAEVALAIATGETAQLVAGSKLDLKTGGEGLTLMAVVSEGLTRINHKDAVETAKKALTGLGGRGASAELKGVIGNLLKGRLGG